jgi:hypothetical protein
MRSRVTSIASRVKAQALDARDAIVNTLDDQRECATDALTKAGRKARRFSRRYPLPIFASALAVGFLIGRIRR